jgi:hypothetical protein
MPAIQGRRRKIHHFKNTKKKRSLCTGMPLPIHICRGCLSAAPTGREASSTAGIQAAQHAFFASFLARARKEVARRGETRPANPKNKKIVITAQIHLI